MVQRFRMVTLDDQPEVPRLQAHDQTPHPGPTIASHSHGLLHRSHTIAVVQQSAELVPCTAFDAAPVRHLAETTKIQKIIMTSHKTLEAGGLALQVSAVCHIQGALGGIATWV